MKKVELPETDSIRALAEFWDTHDLTDFDSDLEDVSERVFERDAGPHEMTVRVLLEEEHASAVEKMAQAHGISREQLIRQWVLKEIGRANPSA